MGPDSLGRRHAAVRLFPPHLKELLIFADTGKDGQNAATHLPRAARSTRLGSSPGSTSRATAMISPTIYSAANAARADYPEWQPPGTRRARRSGCWSPNRALPLLRPRTISTGGKPPPQAAAAALTTP